MPEITMKLSYATVAAIDAMRGESMSRERWLGRAVRQVIEDGLRKPGTVREDKEEEED